MNKNKIIKAMPTVLFACGIVGVFVSEVLCVTGTLKAEKILKEKKTVLKPGENPEDVKAIYHTNDKGYQESQIIVKCDTMKDYRLEVIKATWKCYIPTAVTTALTLSALIASRTLTARQIALLSSAVAGTSSLVTRYRNEIRERFDETTLADIDKKVAADEIAKAKPPVVTTSGLLSTDVTDLSDNNEVLFFDPFTKMKFRSTKLAVLGAKYYLNRNFALGGCVPLSMFYEFLGMALPEEYNYCEWDVTQMEDDGYYWIDIDLVRSDEPDPETGEVYYILEYGFEPGESEDNYYIYGNPMWKEGSFAK